ncbi:MAG: PepSY-like domain-containing protein [Chitinophagaceae bacterium]
MKRNALLLLAAMITYVGATAQEKEKEEKSIPAPAVAKAAFSKAFPGASKVKWEKENSDYEVNFTKDGKEMSAVYDSKGVLKETEVEITAAELPAAATEYIKQHYKGATVKEAAKITTASGTVTYEAEVNKKDVIFDANGKFIKEEKD